MKESLISCEIRTPQHKDGKVAFWINQIGKLNTETLEFIPEDGCPDGHKVQFHSMDNFLDCMVWNTSTEK